MFVTVFTKSGPDFHIAYLQHYLQHDSDSPNLPSGHPKAYRNSQTIAFVWTGTQVIRGRLRMKYDGTRAQTRFRLSAERMSPFKLLGRQSSRLLAAEVCASVVVMLDTPCSEVV